MSGLDFPAALPGLETPRWRLRPHAPSDAKKVQWLAGEKAVADTALMIPHPYPDGAAAAWIGTHSAKWAAHEEFVLAITLKSSGELWGAIGLIIQEAPEKAGRRREGMSPHALKKNGAFCDAVFYGILRRDWPGLR